MIWLGVAVFGFFVYAGLRLLRHSAAAAPAAPAPAAVAPEAVDGEPAFELAGRLRRFAARLVDGLVVLGLTFAVSIVLTLALGGAAAEGGTSRLRWAAYITVVVVQAAYEIGFLATSGQTPGKSALRIRVVSLETATHPGPGAAFARWLVPAIAGVIVPVVLSPSYLNGTGGLPASTGSKIAFVAGLAVYLWAFVDQRRQGIHDKVAGTVVVVAPG